MPWQALLAHIVFAAVLTTGVAVLQIVVPQDSYDKLLWLNTPLRWRQRNRTEKPVVASPGPVSARPAGCGEVATRVGGRPLCGSGRRPGHHEGLPVVASRQW